MPGKTRDERRAAARAEREAAERAANQAQQRKRRLLQLGGVLVVAAAIVVAAIAVASSGGGSSSPTRHAGETVAGQREIARQLHGIPQRGIALGEPRAPVTVVEFGDLQCPVCAAFSNTEMPKLVQRYVRPGKARLELRLLTFIGPDSERLGAMAAAAAQQDRLFTLSELVYANQGEENSGYATDAYLRRIGGAVSGLDVERALRDRDGAKASQQLADASRLASTNHVEGTPTFLVGRTGGTLEAVPAADLGAELARLTS
jgi:protein-disulfide isomerase